MHDIDAAEEQIVTERLNQKLNEVNSAAQSKLSSIKDPLKFTLQRMRFKCAYECFDRRRHPEDKSNCVESCNIPDLQAQKLVKAEMAKFQERLTRSIGVCQKEFFRAKLENRKLENSMTDVIKSMESCVNQSFKENLNLLPHLVAKFKASVAIEPLNECYCTCLLWG
ncbi:uncharacterized protein [Rutidosis leptorrhynchoides]|uniref:uncharacterized protein n=1 Tax=Rutidosis leptorrhynchoides TaxID=125765 RepID=UPI003A9A3753